MRKTDYDVVIVGGGPSGLRLAGNLSGKGYKTAVFEAKPNYKVGSHIIWTLRSLVTEATGGDESAVVLCTKYVVGSIRSSYCFIYPEIRGCMVEMSTILEAYSQHIGDAELYFRHRVTNINATPEKVTVEVSTPEGILACSGKILAACDGVNSISNKTFGGGPKPFLETEYYFEGVKADAGCFQNFHTHKYSPSGLYLCIFHISPTQVVVAIGIGEQPQPAKPLLDTFIQEHPAAQELGLRRGKIIRQVGGVTALSKGRLLQERVIFLGDAGAGFPWLGGMMYDGAMKTADIATEPITEALETNDPGCLKRYEVAWEEAFTQRYELEAAVVAALRQLTDEEIDAVIANFKGVGSLRKAIIAAGEKKQSSNSGMFA